MNETNIIAGFIHGFSKLDPDRPAEGLFEEYTLHMCKNQSRNAQIAVSALRYADSFSVSVSHLTDGVPSISASIVRQRYIKCRDKRYPDPLLPPDGEYAEFSLTAGKSTSFFIRVKADKRTPSCKYEYVVSIKNRDTTVKTLYLYCVVHDISLPDKMACSAVTGLYRREIDRFHGDNGSKEHYKKYYDFLLDHHVNAYDLPYDILDSRCDTYLDDERVSAFRVKHSLDDDKLRAVYNKLSANKKWLDKAFFYPCDEPGSVSALDEMATVCKRLKALCPGIKTVVPFFQDIDCDDTDQIDIMLRCVDIICPKSFCFTKESDLEYGGKLLYSTSQRQKYPPFERRMENAASNGALLWWYVCWEPGLPYLNMYVDMSGMQNALLFWQQKLYGVNGFLYWACNYWKQVDDPWENMATVGTSRATDALSLSDDVFGDGSLLYPGAAIGTDGPCASFRLEMIREGIEDFELLTMFEKLEGKTAAVNLITSVTGSLVRYTDDEDAFSAARVKLIEGVERALVKNVQMNR